MISTVLLPIILFGILVFIHELGHFLVAKASDVKVERFALGFGPALLKKKWGETEYALCALPLGGYVKMLGEDPESGAEGGTLDPRSFAAKKPATRIAIVAMGPLSNLILPVVLFSALYMVGMPTPIAQIGRVIPDYPAQTAGLRAGDRILEINGKSLWRWSDMTELLQDRGGMPTSLKVDRRGQILNVNLTPVREMEPNVYGEIAPSGKIGVDLQPFLPVLGISNPDGPAAKRGFKTGDTVKKVNGTPVIYWWQFEEALAQNPVNRNITVERAAKEKTTNLELSLPPKQSLKELGLEEGELYLREVMADSVAEQKGLRAGDRLVSVNGKTLSSWYEFHKNIQGNKGEALVIGIQRDRKPMTIELVPKEVVQKDDITRAKRAVRQLGVVSAALGGDPAFQLERYTNPFKATAAGFRETLDITGTTVAGMVKLIRGKLSVDTLGGPISIFYLAGSSYKAGGWVSFLRMMAILSITLGVLNFFPIPVLDGGHLLFFAIEWIKGSPVHVRIREIAQNIGVALIVGLMVLVFYVDINRYLVDHIKALFN